MTSRGEGGEGFPVPAYAHAHVRTHTQKPPHPPPPPRARIGEAACFQACPRCRRHVLIATVGGILTRADPENLTTAGELAARLQNRLTFDIHIYGLPRRMYLEFRDIDRIRGPRKRPVVAQHRCGELVLAHGPVDDSPTGIVISYRRELPDVPPF